MGIGKALTPPHAIIKKGRPDLRRAKAALHRILESSGDAKLGGKTVEQIVQMARGTREQIWKEKLASRP